MTRRSRGGMRSCPRSSAPCAASSESSTAFSVRDELELCSEGLSQC